MKRNSESIYKIEMGSGETAMTIKLSAKSAFDAKQRAAAIFARFKRRRDGRGLLRTDQSVESQSA